MSLFSHLIFIPYDHLIFMKTTIKWRGERVLKTGISIRVYFPQNSRVSTFIMKITDQCAYDTSSPAEGFIRIYRQSELKSKHCWLLFSRWADWSLGRMGQIKSPDWATQTQAHIVQHTDRPKIKWNNKGFFDINLIVM